MLSQRYSLKRPNRRREPPPDTCTAQLCNSRKGRIGRQFARLGKRGVNHLAIC